ncbi:hypothetical protein [Bradyrhizobium elkanii]|uniref:hypothetical protein n=1 Tax=Bradyrhizobium elkanii TaxID=29448 RepID=UPI002226A8F0|nr:hypothetical protein [Bradyrhizobium elkanii]MCW2114420.1 hypothetical protein [Bradyrhizobium elkanii]
MSSPPDHYDKVAISLGHLVIAFNELEVALGGALMHLLKQDEDVGAAFIAHLGASQKIRLLQELEGKIDHEATRQEFHDLVCRVDEINSQRNHLIHAEYMSVYVTEQLPVLLRRRLRDFMKPVKFPVTIEELSKKYVQMADPEEITELANDAAELAINLIQLSENLY